MDQPLPSTSATTTIPLGTDRMIAEIDGPIGWLTFNNPARRNAVSFDMWEALGVAIQHFEDDPAVRVIVLRGAGEAAFVSGADISQFDKLRNSAENVARYDATSDQSSRKLSECSKPTIAMIQGWCIGGGVGIAVSCDLRLAADDAKFGVPAARLGLGYGATGVKKLLDLVGIAFTKEIFFTARHFVAEEAKAMGLVNRVVPKAELEALVREYCANIAQNAPLTIHALKRTVTELAKSSPEADLDLCAMLVGECFASADYIEGRTAFMEKRKPVFAGR
jgi:enoyl-CoA hydratase/carnithine racemase